MITRSSIAPQVMPPWLEVKCQFYFYFIEVRRKGGGFDRDLDDGVGDGNVVPAGFVHNPQQ